MEKNGLIWGDLLHFGYNMWHNTPRERAFNIPPGKSEDYLSGTSVADHVRCDPNSWRVVTDHAADKGLNMIMIDVGEALIYPSHPELAVKGSWDVDRFRAELARLRSRGLEPIPKLNFSACHDTWLGEYERMVSTPTYYKVCADLIRDVAEVFDHPRFLHIGYDEEDFGNQRMNELAIVRNGELWWHDFLWFIKTVEDAGMRPMAWSDYCWRHRDEYLRRCPKVLLQSNWYYRQWFDFETIPPQRKIHLETFIALDKAGFDQLPCGSVWACDENFPGLVEFCRKHIDPSRLKGFLMAPWMMCKPSNDARQNKAIDIVADARKRFYPPSGV
ncbi:MAG: hypothetical protein IKO72_16330 [Kiritimatiellae bacterium]|nr:hypothetical protein [Kiritimatiellia bacterium]